MILLACALACATAASPACNGWTPNSRFECEMEHEQAALHERLRQIEERHARWVLDMYLRGERIPIPEPRSWPRTTTCSSIVMGNTIDTICD